MQKTIEETKWVNITFTENENNYKCGSCIVYIVLMIEAFTISTEITFYLFITIGHWLIIIFIALNLIIIKKIKIWWMQLYKMDTTKQINIKDRTYYF